MNTLDSSQPLPFDHLEAHAALSRIDERLASLIERVGKFQFKLDECDSVYESLLEAITYQSISGKAAATIFARIKALGSNGCPTPQEVARIRTQTLRKAGLSGAKILAVKVWRAKRPRASSRRSPKRKKCPTRNSSIA